MQDLEMPSEPVVSIIWMRAIWAGIILALAALVCPVSRAPASVREPSKPVKSSSEIPEKAHFVTLFTYGNHVFAAFTKTHPLTVDLVEHSDLETSVISWLPKDGSTDPRNRAKAGRNYSLSETLERARTLGQKVTAYGPFNITESLYQKSLRQTDRLDAGGVHFRRDLGEGRELGTDYFGATALADVETEFGLVDFGSSNVPGDKAARLILQKWKPAIKKPSKTYDSVYAQMGIASVYSDGIRREGMPSAPSAKKAAKKSGKFSPPVLF